MTARPAERLHGVAGLMQHWRDLRWAPPLLAVAITVEVAMGGSNGWASRPAAMLANILIAGSILATVAPSSRLWDRMRVPFLLCVAALLWAGLPRLLPASIATLFGVPPHPAPDRMIPDLAEAVSRLSLVMAACAVTYRLHTTRPILLWLAVAGGVYAGWMIATPLPWRLLSGAGQGRFAATIGNWNAAGAYFGMIALLCLALILAPPASGCRRGLWLFALPLAAALLLCMATQSRSAFTLTAVALVVSLMRKRRLMTRSPYRTRAAALTIGFALVTMAIAYLGSQALFPRYLALSADGLSRWDIVTTYAGYTLDSPLWGFGPGSFFEVNQARLTPATALRFSDFGAAHNAALQIALEDGWPALLLLALGVAVIAYDALRRDWGAEETGLAGALVILAGASMVDIAWNVPAIGALGCVLLGALWGGRTARRPRPQRIRRSSTGRARGVPVTS